METKHINTRYKPLCDNFPELLLSRLASNPIMKDEEIISYHGEVFLLSESVSPVPEFVSFHSNFHKSK